jgi:hypothetical protein
LPLSGVAIEITTIRWRVDGERDGREGEQAVASGRRRVLFVDVGFS